MPFHCGERRLHRHRLLCRKRKNDTQKPDHPHEQVFKFHCFPTHSTPQTCYHQHPVTFYHSISAHVFIIKSPFILPLCYKLYQPFQFQPKFCWQVPQSVVTIGPFSKSYRFVYYRIRDYISELRNCASIPNLADPYKLCDPGQVI